MIRTTVAALAAIAVLTASSAGASPDPTNGQTIDEVVQGQNGNTPESPFIRYLWENGFGYLSISRAWFDGNIACQNRRAGVPPTQVIPLLESRGYTAAEAQALVKAEATAVGDRLSGPVC